MICENVSPLLTQVCVGVSGELFLTVGVFVSLQIVASVDSEADRLC